MIELSPAARAMLQRGRWHKAERNPATIIECITKAGRPWFQPVVDFQARYGGLEYVARDGDGFHFDLFLSGSDVRKVQLAIDQEEDGEWYYEIGTHRIAQFNFGLRQDGVVCTAGDEGMVPIASTVDKFIEDDAVTDEMLARQPRCWQVPLGAFERNDLRLDALAGADRAVLQSASDAYTTWWVNDDSRVRRGAAYDEGLRLDMGFGFFETYDAAERFREHVRMALGKSCQINSYP
jgi:hypothetical protein